ncbi:MAG: UDP-N-acetylmuramate dehydrogenase [Gammaproteobacteria bacterium]|nr:UDP-N-acetylmuramate dehydrogenase [Gammaproteobacteria bacterium]
MNVDSVVSQGEVIHHMPLTSYTTWRAGGAAERLYPLTNLSSLATFLRKLPPQEKITWLGLGSNTLVRDGGIAGTTVINRGGVTRLEQLDGQTIYANAATPCGRLARFAAQRNLGGVEFLAGIPGTVGGALRMNAGCFGGEIWQWVAKVVMITRHGEFSIWPASAFKVSYRQVVMPEEYWFTGCYFHLESKDKKESLKLIRDIIAKRNASQPTSLPSCGSVFRNPPGDFAARLIDQCGLKGYRIGGAMVSPKHANFIVNSGGASASEIEQLIEHVAEVVETKMAVKLEKEVKIIGVSVGEQDQ